MHNFLKKYNYDKSLIPDSEFSGPTNSSILANAAMESSDDAIASLELKDSNIQYPFFPGFRSELSFFEEADPLPAPHIKEIVQVFDELGITVLDDHKLERPLWSLANIDASNFEGLPIAFSISPKLSEIRKQMLGESTLPFTPVPK